MFMWRNGQLVWVFEAPAEDNTGSAAEDEADHLEEPEDDEDEELRQESDGYEDGERFVVVEDDEDESQQEPSGEGHLIQQLVSQLRQQQQPQSQPQQDETAGAIRDLVEQLKEQNKPKQQQGKTAEEKRQEYEQLKKEAKENFWDDPVTYIEKLNQYNSQSSKEELYPILNQIVGNVSESSKKISRTAAREDSTNALVLDNYADEVEAEVAQLPATADVYNQACQRVAQRHLSDIIQMQVDQQLEQRRKPKKRASNSSLQGRSDQTRTQRSTPVADGKYRVTPTEHSRIQSLAKQRGVDEETAYDYLVAKGQIKAR